MVDRFTKWPEAVPIKDITAETVAAAFLETWIARYGAQGTVTTDQGRQLESHLFKKLAKLTGTIYSHTTAYHPTAHGLQGTFGNP